MPKIDPEKDLNVKNKKYTDIFASYSLRSVTHY